MRQIILSEDEAKAIVLILKSNWIPLELQRAVYDLISRIEKELEN